MLPEWVYWMIIVVLIIVISVNLYKYYILKEYKNMVKSYDKRIDTTIDKYRRLYRDSMEENKQLKLYLYQNISDYYKRNPDKKN